MLNLRITSKTVCFICLLHCVDDRARVYSSLVGSFELHDDRRPVIQAPTVVNLNLLNPVLDPLIASLPQVAPSRPICASTLPTSLPQAYPALKLIAEKTRTTPAEMNHVIMVGESNTSSDVVAGFVTARSFFAFRSLLDSRDLRLGASFGDREGDLRALSSDSGTSRRVVG